MAITLKACYRNSSPPTLPKSIPPWFPLLLTLCSCWCWYWSCGILLGIWCMTNPLELVCRIGTGLLLLGTTGPMPKLPSNSRLKSTCLPPPTFSLNGPRPPPPTPSPKFPPEDGRWCAMWGPCRSEKLPYSPSGYSIRFCMIGGLWNGDSASIGDDNSSSLNPRGLSILKSLCEASLKSLVELLGTLWKEDMFMGGKPPKISTSGPIFAAGVSGTVWSIGLTRVGRTSWTFARRRGRNRESPLRRTERRLINWWR